MLFSLTTPIIDFICRPLSSSRVWFFLLAPELLLNLFTDLDFGSTLSSCFPNLEESDDYDSSIPFDMVPSNITFPYKVYAVVS